jgi:BirA family biotin operon repressor/biotin-[acetyl-CoA-carboxylase] ligase
VLAESLTNRAAPCVGDAAWWPLADGPMDLGLRSRLVGKRVHYLKTVDSTNSVLRSLAEGGEPPGTVVLADEQTGGRGRAGRGWFSPAGLGLWLSVLLRPRSQVRELAPLSLVVSASVAEAVASSSGASVGVKWPNDIVVADRKLGGILLESLQDSSGSVERVIVGIGVNVDLERCALPDELSEKAVSLLMLTGRRTPRLPMLRSVLERLDEDWTRFEREGPAASLERWRSLSTTLGREVEVTSEASTTRGTAVDVSPSGALVVEQPDGRRVEVWHGNVSQREETDD